MTKPAGNPPATSMRSLERAIDVLEVLDGSRHALRLSEIARRAGLPVATTQRILGVLESRGRVELVRYESECIATHTQCH